MMPNLLAIKFHTPSLLPKLVKRPHLFERLSEGLSGGRSVTLVSAPAGFGKTTCISEWVNELDLPVSWLALDTSDDEPGRFFSYFVAALQKVDGSIGGEVAAALRGGQLPPVEIITTSVLNDITNSPQQFVLVLDDFQVVRESYILKSLETLIANQPRNMHLVLVTREDPPLPLARLRASNLLTEVRVEDLRFSEEETDRLLNEIMCLSLSPAEISALEQRTEGWIVGLQLAGVSMRGRTDRSTFIETLSGSHRFILSYLTEEVLNRQPEEIREFLLRTSILERMCAPLCDAILENREARFENSQNLQPSATDSWSSVLDSRSSQSILEYLERSNLFVIPLDDEQRWYRYHHLFADLLRVRQQALLGEKTVELHRQASRWFAQACKMSTLGERADLASEAIRHALAAADYPSAVQLIEDHAMDVLMQWYAKMVSGWMQALPPEWKSSNPRLNLVLARVYLMQGNFLLAQPYLERLQTIFSKPAAGEKAIPPGMRSEWLAIQSSMMSAQGVPSQALELARQAQEIVPKDDSYAQSQVYLALAVAYQQLDDKNRSVEAHQKLIELGRTSGDVITEALGISSLGLMAVEGGQLRYGYELASRGAELIERSGAMPPILTGIYGELGVIAFHWNQLEKAEHYLQRAARVSELGGFSDAELFYSVIRSRLAQVRGDLGGAAAEIQKAADLMRVDAPVVVREEVIAQQVNIYLAHDNLAAAEQILFREFERLQGKYGYPDIEPGLSIPYPRGVLYIGALRIFLVRARSKNPATEINGIEFADRLMDALLQRQYIPLALETLLLRAQIHAAMGDPKESLADFSAALDMAQPEGYISPFIMEGQPAAEALTLLRERTEPGRGRAEFIEKILQAYPMEMKISPHMPEEKCAQRGTGGYFESLTEREVEVLRLMVEGSTYEEIASAMVVSINTVRTHVKSIYGKLGVNNRTAAIEAGRLMGVI